MKTPIAIWKLNSCTYWFSEVKSKESLNPCVLALLAKTVLSSRHLTFASEASTGFWFLWVLVLFKSEERSDEPAIKKCYQNSAHNFSFRTVLFIPHSTVQTIFLSAQCRNSAQYQNDPPMTGQPEMMASEASTGFFVFIGFWVLFKSEERSDEPSKILMNMSIILRETSQNFEKPV